MKKGFAWILCLGLLLMSLSVSAEGMTPGDYTATCKGFYGDFNVTVSVSEDAITSIAIEEYAETETLGGEAIRQMTEAILDQNTVNVDAVAGATVTSAVFRAAIMDCLKQANAPEAFFAAPKTTLHANEEISTDVLVVGSGVAGFAAAIAAAQNGADVLMIEKQDVLGGSSVTSAGIVYAALDEADVPTMVSYYMDRAEGKANEELLTFYAEQSLNTLAFYEGLGVQWMMAVPAGTAPEPRARFSMMQDGTAMTGAALILPMEEKASALGVKIRKGLAATELLTDDAGAVIGARATEKTGDVIVYAGAVVLATGGFDASEEMKAAYSPIASGDFPLSAKSNEGDGIRMGMAVGADTLFQGGVIGFDFVNGSLPNSGMNAIAMYCNSYVLPDGTYVSDVIDYPITYTAIKEAGVDKFYGLYDAKGADTVAPLLGRFAWQGDSVEALAEATGMDAAKLADAIEKGKDLDTPPYFAVDVLPCTIGSMGGLVTDTQSQVLRDGAPIPGLYAAGEVCNGGFYYQEYPASGSSLSISTTYGLEAGRNAAAYCQK